MPETIVTGQTADISPFCKLKWYEWVKFCDTSQSFPNDVILLGQYLGPSLDIGPAMTAKILKANGKVVYQSTYRGLNNDEIKSPIEQRERDRFDKSIANWVGSPVTV